ncbi:hypothetical protein MTX26_20930 [Bradyrhizobium sp. ISRA443]|uniref:hypothetical protein n=1 Tax=unclassified Bradyrhizobium TaxID=2631580 RepID=UPI0024799C68|nr:MULTISPECIES: hypothetical protein [unclassified Bradyrhizobium]WGR92515.1 hypothetical protein MTX20_31640 [Bradyrhizobium sp. ISRA435]WGR96915.1 hypothetical protein MTX23_20930 [Bradyrhizobium sp. ISRA436]WGS03802.1 hypothetical protein MTX18_20930 [Bradyrhizobium sp. ISRA437]WGS10686.1 hypothetical protein MTX26_20930 [Bradyrhizobium sp. ISRA443]
MVLPTAPEVLLTYLNMIYATTTMTAAMISEVSSSPYRRACLASVVSAVEGGGGSAGPSRTMVGFLRVLLWSRRQVDVVTAPSFLLFRICRRVP